MEVVFYFYIALPLKIEDWYLANLYSLNICVCLAEDYDTRKNMEQRGPTDPQECGPCDPELIFV